MFFLPYRTRKKNFRFKRKNCFYLLNFCFMTGTTKCVIIEKAVPRCIETLQVFGVWWLDSFYDSIFSYCKVLSTVLISAPGR